ncbi:complement C3-like, partial [Arapaima gigas]
MASRPGKTRAAHCHGHCGIISRCESSTEGLVSRTSTMGNTVANSNTHVANASGRPARIYYSVDKMRLEEMVIQEGSEIGISTDRISAALSSGLKLIFKRDSRIRFVRIPVSDFIKISGEGNLYVSVFVESDSNPEKCLDAISINFYIPSDRSFIVTPNHGIRFQKYGASIWEDEYGN